MRAQAEVPSALRADTPRAMWPFVLAVGRDAGGLVRAEATEAVGDRAVAPLNVAVLPLGQGMLGPPHGPIPTGRGVVSLPCISVPGRRGLARFKDLTDEGLHRTVAGLLDEPEEIAHRIVPRGPPAGAQADRSAPPLRPPD